MDLKKLTQEIEKDLNQKLTKKEYHLVRIGLLKGHSDGYSEGVKVATETLKIKS